MFTANAIPLWLILAFTVFELFIIARAVYLTYKTWKNRYTEKGGK